MSLPVVLRVETTDSSLFEAINGVTSTIFPVLQVLALAAACLIMLMGVFRVTRSEMREGWGIVVSGVIAGAGAVFLPAMMSGFVNAIPEDPDADPVPTPSGTATPSPSTPSTTAPEPAQEPVDMTWILMILGILGALILLVLLIAVVSMLIQRARRSIRETRKQAEIERAGKARQTAAWQHFHDRHNELLRKIAHSETDWDSLFFMPALTDPNVPQTYAMLRAMRAANTLRDTAGELPGDLTPDTDLTTLPYPRAVEAFALAWDAAERHARRVGQKGVPLAERKVIKQIRTLLDVAENSAASQTERDLAYRRVQSLLESLESIHIPAQAMAQLEERKVLMITAAAEAETR